MNPLLSSHHLHIINRLSLSMNYIPCSHPLHIINLSQDHQPLNKGHGRYRPTAGREYGDGYPLLPAAHLEHHPDGFGGASPPASIGHHHVGILPSLPLLPGVPSRTTNRYASFRFISCFCLVCLYLCNLILNRCLTCLLVRNAPCLLGNCAPSEAPGGSLSLSCLDFSL